MNWTAPQLLELGHGYQRAAVLAAAADLELFDAFGRKPCTAATLARRLACDLRALTILLDALRAIGLIEKTGAQYALSQGIDRFLTFSFEELRADLEHAGFIKVAQVRKVPAMNSVIVCEKAAGKNP